MPLDRAKARKDLGGARSHYRSGIHSEFIQKLAEHLEEALAIIETAGTESQKAQNEVARLQRDLDEEKTHYRKLREQSAHTESLIALLREIEKSPKGASKKAAEQLKLMGLVEEVKTPERVVVA